jgi:molybdate transport system substrate-binding protein
VVRVHGGRLALTTLLAVGLIGAGCGDDDGSRSASAPDTSTAPDATSAPATTGTTGAAVDGSILVFAAASLTDAFGEVESAFETANPDADVEFNFAGSSALREQILEGAPADVFASANPSNMDQVVEAGGVAGEPQIFVLNELQIAVPAGNPGGVTGLDDFADAGLLIGLCAEEVPCGEFGRQALAAAGVEPSIDTNEPDVRALLTKLEADELDAGIVYVTDVAASGDAVEGVDIPAEFNVVAEYPIGALAEAPNSAGAEAFVEFVLSPEGQQILTSYGFGSP